MARIIKFCPDDPVNYLTRAALYQELRGEVQILLFARHIDMLVSVQEQKMLHDSDKAQQLAPRYLRGFYFEAKCELPHSPPPSTILDSSSSFLDEVSSDCRTCSSHSLSATVCSGSSACSCCRCSLVLLSTHHAHSLLLAGRSIKNLSKHGMLRTSTAGVPRQCLHLGLTLWPNTSETRMTHIIRK